MNQKFICPLPWNSISLGPNSTPRVCCHQNGALKNTQSNDLNEVSSLKHNQEIKRKMLCGEIPSECNECYQLEKSGCSSPRQQYLKLFELNPQESKIEYLDITVDNRCNLECIMCSPYYSNRLNPFFSKKLNSPEVEKWELIFSDDEIKKLLPHLKMLTLAGGEPLLSSRSLELLLNIVKSGHASHINLRLFSNLTIIPKDLDTILNAFHSVELIASIDSVGKNYEEIRYPAQWCDIEENIETLLGFKLKNTTINFHSIIMANNWNNISDLIRYYHYKNINSNSLLPIFAEIENPAYLHPKVLSQSEFELGLLKINQAISELVPKNIHEHNQLNSFINLINKIKLRDFKNFHIAHKVYMQKLKSHRKN